MKYRVVTYMRIEPDDDILYDAMEDAEAEVDQLRLMNPQDMHVIEEASDAVSPALSAEDIERRVGAARRLRGIWSGLPPEEGD